MIARHFLILAISLLTLNLSAQKKPEIKALLSFENGYWVLKLESDYDHAYKVMQQLHPERDLSLIDAQRFVELVLGYSDTSFAITRDVAALPMKRVNYEVNSAKVWAKYISERFEKCGKVLVANIQFCSEMEGSEIQLSYKADEKTGKVILNQYNHYTAEIKLKD